MSYKKHPPKAPHFDEQGRVAFEHIHALIGDKAWNAWGFGKDKGNGLEWGLLRDKLGLERDYKPIILDAEKLANAGDYQILKDDVHAVTFCRFGKVTKAQETSLLLAIAQHSKAQKVFFADNLGENKQDLSDYVLRLREDKEAQSTAQAVIQMTEQSPISRTELYVDYRENGKVKGLHLINPKVNKDTGEVTEKETWICDNLELAGEGKTLSGEYYYLFQWQNHDEDAPRTVAIAREDFGTDTGWKMLKAQGLKMTQGSGLTQKLTEYFHFNGNHFTQWTITNVTGWLNGAYLLPNGEIIGEPKKPIYFTDRSSSSLGYTTSGTLTDWQIEIAQNVRGNASMMIGVAVALAAPMLSLLGRESFGVHLFAESSKGKSTTLNIANSIYGNPEKIKLSWSTTATGVKNEAAARNDGFITLDEIGQAKDGKNLETIAYDLFNETDKIRGEKEGGNRQIKRWKVSALSTGEKDLETQLRLQGAKVHAGQLVRLLNVPLEEANNLHNFPNNKAHADHLNEKVQECFGVIGREWIAFLSNNADTVKSTYKIIRQKWLDLSNNMSGQVQRVAGDRFAVLETALYLAKDLTQWTEEESAQAILKNFLNWKEEFGENSREESALINTMTDWLLINESSFIEYPADPSAKIPLKIAGVRVLEDNAEGEEPCYFIYSKIFDEIIEGFPKKMAQNILFSIGLLKKPDKSEKGYNEYLFKIPKKMLGKTPRAYKIVPFPENDRTETE
jgi:putative DNA primase/helicase